MRDLVTRYGQAFGPPDPADVQAAKDFYADAAVQAFVDAPLGSATAAQRDAVIKRTILGLRATLRILKDVVD
jgi:hypothetical protein